MHLVLLLCEVARCTSSTAGTRAPAVSAMSAATAGIGRLRLAALPARTACTSTVATLFRPTTTAFATMVSLCGV